MAFWWVNHKQTHIHEIEGEYIWSPFTKKNGVANQTYLNLKETRPGDIVFSYADGKIKAVGTVAALAIEQARPAEFGKAGEVWASFGWKVPIKWRVLDFPIFPKNYLKEIIPLLPEKYSPIQENGNGNQAFYLTAIPDKLGRFLLALGRRSLLLPSDGELVVGVEEEGAQYIVIPESIEKTTRDQLVKARVGQGLFRDNVERIERVCRVTGLGRTNFLIASHIKPWRWSDNRERIDGNNGLLLSPHVDKLFDKGWITFSGEGALLAATDDLSSVLKIWGINPQRNVGKFNKMQASYLEFHRENIFLGGRPLWD